MYRGKCHKPQSQQNTGLLLTMLLGCINLPWHKLLSNAVILVYLNWNFFGNNSLSVSLTSADTALTWIRAANNPMKSIPSSYLLLSLTIKWWWWSCDILAHLGVSLGQAKPMMTDRLSLNRASRLQAGFLILLDLPDMTNCNGWEIYASFALIMRKKKQTL